jgi:hypothetical protein
MSENNGWPGKPGVPMNPERDGWHWIFLLGGKDNAQVIEWLGPEIGWDETDWTTEDFGLHARYLGPALTPAEVDARLEQSNEAWRDVITNESAKIIAKARREALEEAARAAKKAGERHEEIAGRLGFKPTIGGAIEHACADIRALKGEGDD